MYPTRSHDIAIVQEGQFVSTLDDTEESNKNANIRFGSKKQKNTGIDIDRETYNSNVWLQHCADLSYNGY